MKLKTNKIFIKGLKIKIRNQYNKDWIWNTKNKKDQTVILGAEREKKERKKPTSDKPTMQHQHAPPQK
jgi:hypothetical protein